MKQNEVLKALISIRIEEESSYIDYMSSFYPMGMVDSEIIGESVEDTRENFACILKTNCQCNIIQKKFKDNNNNEEALIDYDDGVSIAMIKSFQESVHFPTKQELCGCLQKTNVIMKFY